MPKNTKENNIGKGRKAVKQERYRAMALGDDQAVYGKVIKVLGFRQFHVVLPDASKRLIEVRATVPKKRALINTDDIVIVAPNGATYEIQATMDRKTANNLVKEKKMHPDLLSNVEVDSARGIVKKVDDNDCGIEFDYTGMKENDEFVKEEDKDSVGEDADVNIDEI
jgi:translation initiation factor IF-1